MSEEEAPVLARECAAQLETSVSSLYRMARAGIVPCIRVGMQGRGVRFVPKEVRQALANRPAWSSQTAHI